MPQSDNRKRVVTGLGDTGVLAAIRLARHADVIGISVKPGLVGGQELGARLSRPDDGARDFWISFDRFNTDWLPAELLDDHGFVRVTPDLRVPYHPGVFAVGDVAATDPLRSSARNRADSLVAQNVRAEFSGRPLRSFRAPKRRWGSVLGVQSDGLEVFAPNGRAFRFPAWSIDRVSMPWIVRRGIYRGLRPLRDT